MRLKYAKLQFHVEELRVLEKRAMRMFVRMTEEVSEDWRELLDEVRSF
jgi:hypothetical protein